MSAQSLSEDLLIRARRGTLDSDEERQLSLALEGSVELRLLFEAGREFDRESPVVRGDEALLERLASRCSERDLSPIFTAPTESDDGRETWQDAVRAGLRRTLHRRLRLQRVDNTSTASRVLSRMAKPRRKRYGSASILVAAVLCIGSAAAASWMAMGGSQGREEESTAGAVANLSIAAMAATPAVSGIAAGRETRPAPREADAIEPSRVDTRQPSASIRSSSRSEPKSLLDVDDNLTRGGEDAAILFKSANLARREGDTQRAIALYTRLLQRYPATAEAQHARLTAGELELQRGSAARAMALFAHYGNGPLAAEALWGQARALGTMGRIAEERAVMEKLLRHYPDAPCSTAARKRLRSGSR